MALKFPSIPFHKTWVMLLAALVLAALATLLTVQFLKSREAALAEQAAARAKSGGPQVAVVVPTRDLPAGTPLDKNIVAAREIQSDLLYPDTVKVEEFDKFKGQALIRPVYRGRPLLKADFRPAFADFAGTLVAGTRAITIDIDELNSIAHMVQPGNRIDLMLIMKRDDGGQTVVPFMEQMKVLATGQKIIQDGSDDRPGVRKTQTYTTFTLEVTPTQAGRIALSLDIGKLRAVLRNETDKVSEDFSVNAQNIFDEVTERTRQTQEKIKLAAPKRGLAGMVEYIIGGARSGPTARSVDVPVTGAAPPGTVPYLVPGIAPPQGPAAPAGAAPGVAPSTYGAPQPEVPPLMTPETRGALKDLLEKTK